MRHFIFPGIPLLACIAANLPPPVSQIILQAVAALFIGGSICLLAYAVRHHHRRH